MALITCHDQRTGREGKDETFVHLAVLSKVFRLRNLSDSIEFRERDGGETGIRTLDTLRYTRFPSVRLQPLGHLSGYESIYVSLPELTAIPPPPVSF